MNVGKRRSRRYYGWTMTWTFALTETVSWGILQYAFSALLVPMQEDLGWSAAAITGAYSLSMLVTGLAAPFVGRWIDARGPRALMTAGSVAGTLLVLAWSRVETLTGFYLLWIGIGLASAATLYEPAFTTLTQWFERDRARAMLIVTIAAGFASTIFLPLTGWLVESNGWRSALVILAVMLGVMTIPAHALLLRERPEDLGLQPDGWPVEASAARATAGYRAPSAAPRAILADPGFRWMTLAFFLQMLASIAIGVHLIAYLTERGDGATFAATATGLIGAAQVAARIVTTLLDRRVSLISLTAIVFLLQAVAFAILVLWAQPAGVIVSVILLGMGRGAVTLIRPGLIADLYGREHFGTINGMQTLVVTGGRAIAPVATGAAYALAGGYTPVLWALAGISVLSAVAMLRVNRSGSPAVPVSG
jgi:MFS family permease